MGADTAATSGAAQPQNEQPQAQPTQAERSDATAPSAPAAQAAPSAPAGVQQQQQPAAAGVPCYNPYNVSYAPVQNPYLHATSPPQPAPQGQGQPGGLAPLQITPNQQAVLSYTGAPPFPPPPVSNKTPEEMWQNRIVNHNAYKAAEEERSRQKQNAPKKGWFSQMENTLQSLSHKANAVCSDLSFGAEKALRDSEIDAFVCRYNRNFPQIAPQHRLLAGYECTFYSGSGEAVPGSVLITERHFAFAPEFPTAQRPPVFDELRNVVTYQITQTLGEPALLVFTGANFVFHFAQFHKNMRQQVQTLWGSATGTPFHNFLTYFDHQWRQCTVVPVPNYPYAPNPVYQQPVMNPVPANPVPAGPSTGYPTK